MGRTENSIEQYLVTQAEKENFLCPKFTSPGTDGVPDRILIGNGCILFVETKAPGESPRPLQEAVIRLFKQHGADVRVIDTKGQVDQLILELKEKQRGAT